MGGPSIIFNHYQQIKETLIHVICDNYCETIEGYDCNGLYSFVIAQSRPPGVYVRRSPQDDFCPKICEDYINSYVWMDYLMKTHNILMSSIK